MAEFSITVGIQNVPGAAQFIQGAIFPRVSTAVRLVAQQAQADWMEAIDNAKLWSGEKRPYMASIQWEMTGPLSALVWSDYKYAAEIETGLVELRIVTERGVERLQTVVGLVQLQ